MNAAELTRGDIGRVEVLVDGSPYGVGKEWAPLTGIAPGSAAVYPLKVRLSNGAPAQYKAAEVEDVRIPRPYNS